MRMSALRKNSGFSMSRVSKAQIFTRNADNLNDIKAIDKVACCLSFIWATVRARYEVVAVYLVHKITHSNKTSPLSGHYGSRRPSLGLRSLQLSRGDRDRDHAGDHWVPCRLLWHQ